MADLLTLNCPTCGGNLQVTNDVERFVCAHCGNAHIVDPGVRVESLAAEVEKLRDESRVRYLIRGIDELEKQRDQLRAEIDRVRSNAVVMHHAYQLGIVITFVTAVALTVHAISFLDTERSGAVFGSLVLAAFPAAVCVVMIHLYPSTKTTPVLDTQLQKVAVVEGQLAKEQRELEMLQWRAGQLASYTDEPIDMQHALRITTP